MFAVIKHLTVTEDGYLHTDNNNRTDIVHRCDSILAAAAYIGSVSPHPENFAIVPLEVTDNG